MKMNCPSCNSVFDTGNKTKYKDIVQCPNCGKLLALKTDAEFMLGEMYFNGDGVEKDLKEAFKWYSKAAKRENELAQYKLGYMHEHGYGVEQNYPKAAKLYLDIPNNVEAQCGLGNIYLSTESYKDALIWYYKAAEQGNSDALYDLGLMYENGKGVAKDSEEAVKLYVDAAERRNKKALKRLKDLGEQRNPYALYNLGLLYEHGKVVKKNSEKAVKLYVDAAELGNEEALKRLQDFGEQGNSDALYNLGLLYEYGKGVTKDLEKAVEWYYKAAKQGNEDAIKKLQEIAEHEDTNVNIYSLGLLYEQGKCITNDFENIVKSYVESVEQGDSEALGFLQKMADLGNGFIQYTLGEIYECGKGIQENIINATEWYYKSAEQGNREALNRLQDLAKQGNLRALYKLGFLYENGKGVAKDFKMAVGLYMEAAEKCSSYAMKRLQELVMSYSKLAEQGDEEALNRLQDLAEQGNSGALYNLGLLYEQGKGVAKDSEKAESLYVEAAKHGSSEALEILRRWAEQGNDSLQYMLGGIDESKNNITNAIKWYSKAAERGNEEALGRLQNLGWQGISDALYNLGLLYEHGKGVAEDSEKSVKLYVDAAKYGRSEALEILRRRAEQGNACLQYTLGGIYESKENIINAIKWYTKAAEQGNVDALNRLQGLGEQGNSGALYNLGLMYEQGKGVDKDSEKSVRLYVEAAKHGNKDALERLQNLADQENFDALYNLGFLYEEGKCIVRNLERAVRLYSEAAEQGNLMAISRLAFLYEQGKGVTNDFEKALRLYIKAAGQGNSDALNRLQELADKENAFAQYNIGILYEQGNGVAQNLDLAATLYCESAEQGESNALDSLYRLVKQGNSVAQCKLAGMYERGKGVDQNLDEASKLYFDSCKKGNSDAKKKLQDLADQGNAIAQYKLGWMYDHGKGVLENKSKAFELYQKAAEQEYVDAQYILGVMYEKGSGVVKNFKSAIMWYRKAEEHGCINAKYSLGIMYEYGRGVRKDCVGAARWYKEAMEGGHDKARVRFQILATKNIDVQCDLANMARQAKNYGRAIELYSKSAEGGNADALEGLIDLAGQGYESAQYILGLLYENGNGVKQKYDEAAKWYRKVAYHGNIDAQLRLGYMYEHGKGVEQDYFEAVEWYRKVAYHGNVDAQLRLGYMYEHGKGVEQDYLKAVEWYCKAVNHGSEEALKHLHELANLGNASAKYGIGVIYEQGKYFQKNIDEAIKWYENAARQGDKNALMRLLELAQHGNVTVLMYLHELAKLGDTYVQCNLGSMYENGNGVKQDRIEALKWYIRAARKSNQIALLHLKKLANWNSAAQYTLGVMYENGEGVKKDWIEAIKYYNMAVKKENAYALRRLQRLYWCIKYSETSSLKHKSYTVTDDFIFVEGGEFQLKSDDTEDLSLHRVSLDSFYICDHQVTQNEWQSIIGTNPSRFRGKNKPVEQVSWYDVLEFCNVLSEIEGFTPCYDINKSILDQSNKNNRDDMKWSVTCNFYANGYRLPTEAEWEFAARGGNESGAYEYSGSDTWDDVAWYEDNSLGKTNYVKKKMPNELGLYDMSGNIWEWCWDWYGDYIPGLLRNPTGPSFGMLRVVRGGSWNSTPCGVAYRGNFEPNKNGSGIGFRLVRSWG